MKRLTNISQQSKTVLKLPLVELAGESRILVENHLGVVAYSTKEIKIKVCYGTLSIIGCDLYFAQIQKEQIVINGQIYSITILRG